MNLKPFLILLVIILNAFWCGKYRSYLNHHLMTNIWEKSVSIFSISYLITIVPVVKISIRPIWCVARSSGWCGALKLKLSWTCCVSGILQRKKINQCHSNPTPLTGTSEFGKDISNSKVYQNYSEDPTKSCENLNFCFSTQTEPFYCS